MKSRADKYTELLDVVTTAVNEDFDAELDVVEQQFDDDMAIIKNRIEEIAISQNKDLSSMDAASDEYITFINSCSSDETLSNFIASKFNESNSILKNLSYYLNPNFTSYTAEIQDDSVLQPVEYPSIIENYISYTDVVKAKANEVISNAGLNGSMSITLSGGYTTLDELVSGIISNANSSSSAFSKINLNLTDVNGNKIEKEKDNVGYSYQSLCDDLQNAYTSVVTYAAGFLASTKESVADRLSVFDSFIHDRINMSISKISNSTRSIRDKLSSAKNTSVDFFNEFINLVGWNDYSNTGEIPATIEQTDMSKYTGASPVAALDFSSAKKAIGSTAKVVGKAVAAIGVGLWNIAKGIFSKVKNFIVHTVSDPYDLEKLDNNSSSGLVDGFQYQMDLSGWTICRPIFRAADDTGTKTDEVIEVLKRSSNKWIKLNSMFGEALVKYDNLVKRTNYYDNKYDIAIEADCTGLLKPRSIRSMAITNAAIYADDILSTSHYDSVNEKVLFYNLPGEDWTAFKQWMILFMTRLTSNGDIYNDTGSAENELCAGFARGAQLMSIAFVVQDTLTDYQAIVDGEADRCIDDPEWVSDVNDLRFPDLNPVLCTLSLKQASSVNNLDFIRACSGYYQDGSITFWDRIPGNLLMDSDDYNVSISAFNHFIRAFMKVEWEKHLYPTDYSYYPYSENDSNFSEPQFRIKNDAENASAFSKFLTAAIIVVIVATVATTAVVLLKKLSRARYFRRAQQVGQMDNAMWNGASLTPKQQKKYIRYSRKMNKSNLLTSGITGETLNNTLDNVQSLAGKIDTIYTNVTGESSSPLSPFLPSSNDIQDDNASLTRNILKAIKP